VELLYETARAVSPLDAAAMADARSRQARLTKPPGALGVLEELSVQLSGIAGACPPPRAEPAAVVVFAADHGVHAQGVTGWPQEVTAQMVANFVAGGAAVNVLARRAGADVSVVDVGVAADLAPAAGPVDGPVDGQRDRLVDRKVRRGTRDMTLEPAMTRAEAVEAVEIGIEVARERVEGGVRCLLTGDMGIANTTASAALISAFTGVDVTEATGRGTGADDATWRRKVSAVERALARPAGPEPLAVLASVGGLEHAALAGLILGAAAHRVPVVLDGVIAGAAALVVRALCPQALDYCVAGHRSAEAGHAVALDALGLRPLVDLDLRLGEGSGAVLALPLVQSSIAVLGEMATFDSAGVTDKTQPSKTQPS
jgi:nicotinate-nucleotide--dimethylbenzimidazole phosphoribosyltransferase